MKNKTKQSIENLNCVKLKQMYLFALITIAITVLLSQLLIQYNLNHQLNDSRLINISGKQRMLSQKLAKEVLILNLVSDSIKKNEEVSKINETVSLWKFTHYALENGNDSLNFPKVKSATLSRLFADIKPNFDSISHATELLLKNNIGQVDRDKNQKIAQTILDNEGIFLSKMNKIVSQYEAEALEKVTLQRKTEYAILGFTLLVLFLEFLFIFKPTNKRIELLISKLLVSERSAIKLAHDTEVISEIKENSVKELKSLNYAMENTLLYCRIAPDGRIIHIGEKFSKLLQYNPFVGDKTFSEGLTPVAKEQLRIDRVIAEKQRTGWQGDINI